MQVEESSMCDASMDRKAHGFKIVEGLNLKKKNERVVHVGTHGPKTKKNNRERSLEKPSPK